MEDAMVKAVGKFRLFAYLFLLFLLASCAPTQKEQTNTPVSSPPTQKEQTNTPVSSPPAKEQSVFLHHDGLYKYESTDNFVYYLRFFDDGTVLSTSFSLGEIEDGEAWQYLSKDNSTNSESYDEAVSRGDYSLSGSTVKFTTANTSGTVDYTGQIDGDEIRCDVYSHINNGQFSETYVFSQTVDQAVTEQQPEDSPTYQPSEIDKAWKAYDDKDYSNAIKYAQENIDKWESAALKQQLDLEQPPLLGKANDSEKEMIFGNWAL